VQGLEAFFVQRTDLWAVSSFRFIMHVSFYLLMVGFLELYRNLSRAPILALVSEPQVSREDSGTVPTYLHMHMYMRNILTKVCQSEGALRSGISPGYLASTPSPHACIPHSGKPEMLESFTVCGSLKWQGGI